ncbi:MAG: hypothetical protein KNN16_03435 [Thermoflexus hugenholtzii]|uniref:hypothetical protein n=1 Tax=Thermoflexus TaxID=1495649 RepID=UPI001C74AC26|nr:MULTISPECIES: hypothetical protein [Thermoflexus]QWK11339.1 MAG: hypothetical protein KNN16_03435 [Thermoflexus hugenholtzii]
MERLQPYLDALRRWWWFPVLCALLAGLGGYVYTRQQRPVYAARVTLMVGSSLMNPSPDPQEIGLSRTLAQIYGEMARRRPVLEQTIRRLNLTLSPDALARAVETRVVFNASLLEIYVYDFDPERAAALANALAQTLMEQAPGARTAADEQFLQAQLNDIQKKIEDTDRKIQELRQQMARMTSAAELREAQDQLQALEQLKRDYQQTYAQLIGVMNQGRVNTLRVLEPALPPSRPVSPSLLRNLALSGGVGLILSLSVLMALELFMGRAVQWDGGLTMFNLPILGAIPHWRNRRDPLIVRSAPDSPDAESIRSLRLRVLQLLGREGPRTVLVTSPTPEDGKSFVASNLAAALAEAGVRTVLVEADLRGGTVAHLSPQEISHGLVDYLEAEGGELRLEDLLIPIDGGLTILPMGRIPRDPGWLLSSPRWQAMLRQLQERYEMVVLDGPPTLFTAELELLAQAADGTLLVVRDGETPRRMVGQARYVLRGQRILGLVVNDVPRRKLGQRYGYAYGYGYGYGRYRERAEARGLAHGIRGWWARRRARPAKTAAWEKPAPSPASPEPPAASLETPSRPLFPPPVSMPGPASEPPAPSAAEEVPPMEREEARGPFLGLQPEELEGVFLEETAPAAEVEPAKAKAAAMPFVDVDPELLQELLDGPAEETSVALATSQEPEEEGKEGEAG